MAITSQINNHQSIRSRREVLLPVYRKHRQRDGFTLFELVAVVVVIAILAGTVAFSVRGHVANAKFETFLDRLETFDGQVRRDARRRRGFTTLLFDLHERRIYQEVRGAPTGSGRAIAVPAAVDIERIMTRSGLSDSGVLRVPISPLGHTDTYALRLRASSGREVWMVVLGATGQCLKLDRESDVAAMLSFELAAAGSNAG